jgi:hypothetical protein
MHRRQPSAEDVTTVWALLDLKPNEKIYYWFEDSAGNVNLGVTDGTNDWEVELVASGTSYIVDNPDWRELEIVCVG